MATNIAVSSSAWVCTDIHGKIEIVSPTAREILGADLGRGRDLVALLPIARKAVLRDIEIALTGWPARRTVVLEPAGARAQAVTYRVSQQLKSGRTALFWQLDLTHVEMLGRCA